MIKPRLLLGITIAALAGCDPATDIFGGPELRIVTGASEYTAPETSGSVWIDVEMSNRGNAPAYVNRCPGPGTGFYIDRRDGDVWVETTSIGIVCRAVHNRVWMQVEPGEAYDLSFPLRERGDYRVRVPFAHGDRRATERFGYSNEFSVR